MFLKIQFRDRLHQVFMYSRLLFCHIILVYIILNKTIVFPSSALESTPNEYNLDIFRSFLNLFTPCTIHVIRNDVVNRTINYNMKDLCTGDSVNLHSTKSLHAIINHSSSELSIKIVHTNVSLLFQGNIFSKYRYVCHAEFILPSLNVSSVVQKLSLQLEYKHKLETQRYKSFQPDYVIIPIKVRVIKIESSLLTLTDFTRSAIIFLNLSKAEIYVACISCADIIKTKIVRDKTHSPYLLYTISAPNVQLINKIKAVLSISQFISEIRKHSFHQSSFLVSKTCPLNGKRTLLSKIEYHEVNWGSCVKEIIKGKLNCTFGICKNTIAFYLDNFVQSDIPNYYFCPVHGNEFYGTRYSFFFTPNRFRNMYTLLSPFSLQGWFIVLFSWYVVGLVLWLTNIQNNPFFWLSTVIFEQNTDGWSLINSANIFLICAWLYVCHMLRNAYTSNLYTYMVLDLEPSDLPNSFQDMVNWDSVNMLTSLKASKLLMDYKRVFDSDPVSVPTHIYNLTNSALKKIYRVGMNVDARNFQVGLSNTAENLICDLNNLFTSDSKQCDKFDSFAYVTTSDNSNTHKLIAGKLLLLMGNVHREILDYNVVDLFQMRNSFASRSDHVFRSEFEKNLAWISESGIDNLQKKYIIEIKIRDFVLEYDTKSKNTKKKPLTYYLSLWMQNHCFTLYSKEKCDVNFEIDSEVPVKLVDLLAVWILFLSLLVGSILFFAYEWK